MLRLMSEAREQLKFARAFLPADERYISEFSPKNLATFIAAYPNTIGLQKLQELVFKGMHSFYRSMPDIPRPKALEQPLSPLLIGVNIEAIPEDEAQGLAKRVGNWRVVGDPDNAIRINMYSLWTPEYVEPVGDLDATRAFVSHPLTQKIPGQQVLLNAQKAVA